MSQVLMQHPCPREGGAGAAAGRARKCSNQPIPYTAIAAGGRRSPASAGETLGRPTATFPPCTAGSGAGVGRVVADRGAGRLPAP